ncbi:DUF4304 domain-containing protein [Jatrophihabitans sp.]|uniref:DUF4304 domain-containing protein n=1 Tax=Jatrophihabitans sp. TaxID=1932789 RepID=UPI0030C6841E|nr:acyl-CoA synthetase (AMP-forming)/AMP-acid ligase [Jatrophihabitans sp.]
MQPEDERAVRIFGQWKHRDRRSEQAVGNSAAPEVYSDLMKNVFAPALRSAGLRGSSGRFELPSDIYWVQLGFQRSAYNSGDEVRFTVNLSVIRRDKWEARRATEPHLGKEPSPNIKYGAWATQTRIGKLTPGGEDKWWRIVRGAEVDPVRDDALADLVALGVPWLVANASS